MSSSAEGVKVRSMSIARVRRTFKSLEQPEAQTWRSPNFSACTRNHSRPERNLDRSRSPVQVESPGTGMARMSACIHRGLHRTPSIWNNALTFLYYALFNRKCMKPMTREEKGVKIDNSWQFAMTDLSTRSASIITRKYWFKTFQK